MSLWEYACVFFTPFVFPPPSGWCVCLRGVLFVVFGFWPWFGVCCCGFNLVCAPTHMSRRPCNSMLMRRHVSESLLKHTHTSTFAHVTRFWCNFLTQPGVFLCMQPGTGHQVRHPQLLRHAMRALFCSLHLHTYPLASLGGSAGLSCPLPSVAFPRLALVSVVYIPHSR